MGDTGAGGAASFVGAGASLASGLTEAGAARSQGRFAQEQANENARLLELQASDIEKRGSKEASLFRRKVRGRVGSQKAALAAQGIDIGTGVSQEIIGDTARIGEEDASQIRINALREAFGARSQAINTRAQGRFDRIAGRSRSQTSLITGGLGALQFGLGAFKDSGGSDAKSS